MLIENLMRQDLDPLDEARGFEKLTELGHSQRDIADRVGCSQSHVSRRLALGRLPTKAAEMMGEGVLTIRQAEQLAEMDEADLDEVVTLVDQRRSGQEVRDWAVDEAIATLTRRRKHDAAVATGDASGLKRLKQHPWAGCGDHRPCKKSEATHWFVDERSSSIVWARTAKVEARAKGQDPATDGKSDWEIRQERHDAAVHARTAILASLVEREPEVVLDLGLQLLVDQLAVDGWGARVSLDGNEIREALGDSGFADLTDDRPLLVAVAMFASLLDRATDPGDFRFDGDKEVAELWAGLATAGDSEPELLPYGGDPYGDDDSDRASTATGSRSATEVPSPDDIAQGDQDRASSATADRLSDNTVTASDDDDDDLGAVARAAQAEVLAGHPEWENKAPWGTYLSQPVERVVELVGQLTKLDKVRHTLAFERSRQRRIEVVVACWARIRELTA